MRVQLRLFAIAKSLAGRSVIDLDLPEPATVADLKRAVSEMFPQLSPWLPMIRFAVDSTYATDETPIVATSELAAIPPVSGG